MNVILTIKTCFLRPSVTQLLHLDAFCIFPFLKVRGMC